MVLANVQTVLWFFYIYLELLCTEIKNNFNEFSYFLNNKMIKKIPLFLIT